MNWTELCITVKNEQTDLAADICNMALRSGIYVEDYSDLEQGAREIAHIDLIDEELLAKNRKVSDNIFCFIFNFIHLCVFFGNLN